MKQNVCRMLSAELEVLRMYVCSAEEFAATDSDLPVCQDFDDDTWEDDFLAQIGLREKTECISESQENADGENEEDEGENHKEDLDHLPQPNFKNLPRSHAEPNGCCFFSRSQGTYCRYHSHDKCTCSLVEARQATLDEYSSYSNDTFCS